MRVGAMRPDQLKEGIKTATLELHKITTKYRDESGKFDPSGISEEDLVKMFDLNSRLEELSAALAPPSNPIRFSGAGGFPTGGGQSKSAPAYSATGSLKSFTFGATRQENEESAYKFYQWFAASCLRPGSAAQSKAFQYCEENGIAIKALNESTNDQGGALVPPEFDATLIRLLETYGVFRQFTRVRNMASDIRMQPRRTGGVTASWVTEGSAITKSQPTFDNVQLTAKKLAALVVMSSEINEDSAISIGDELAFEIAYAFALAEDQAGFFGDGTSTYGGIQGIIPKLLGLSGTIANIAGLRVASGNLFSEFTLDDFSQTIALLPQYADTRNCGWFCHRSFYYGTMQPLELQAGGTSMTEIATGDRRPRPLFLGYPVNFSQVFPRTDANSQIPVILGDLSMATMMGDRRTRTLFTDPYSLAANDQLQIRGTERIDLIFHDTGNASATAAQRQPGSIVGLISAAS